MKTTFRLTLAFVILSLNSAVWADAGVFTGTGQNLKLISTESIQLVSIDVTIVPGRGRFLYDGSVPGMDVVEYKCQFVLRNLTDNACGFQVGFPVDSQFARLKEEPKEMNQDWVSYYSFIARDEQNTYQVKFQFSDPKKSNNAYSAIFTWMMNLQAKETRTLKVQYRMPMSMTIASTSKEEVLSWRNTNSREIGPVEKMIQEHPWMRRLSECGEEFAGYTTSTGSSWSGNVETATFTVITKPFEKYLEYRGFVEKKIAELPPDQQQRMTQFFPVHNVWWFRDLKPIGWQPVEAGIRWEYKDYKPKEPITICYYLMQFPRLASEADVWVDAILKHIPDPHKHGGELAIAKQILLATYGREPTDKDACLFVEDQIWYSTKKDFVITDLNVEQKAILEQVDRRLEACNKIK